MNLRPTKPDIVFILLDDIGKEQLQGKYQPNALEPTNTPFLDSMTEQGGTFLQFHSLPVCSSTRRWLLTGQPPSVTGMGAVCTYPTTHQDGPDFTVVNSLPKLLATAGYRSAMVGKHHLGGPGGVEDWPASVAAMGFEKYAVNRQNLAEPYLWGDKSYFQHTILRDDGSLTPTATHATEVTVAEAVRLFGELGDGSARFLHVCFHLAHTPYHAPPARHHELDLSGHNCRSDSGPCFQAMVQTADSLVEKLVREIRAMSPEAWIFVLSDNGSPEGLAGRPFPQDRVKGTCFVGGVNVPCIVDSPEIAAGTVFPRPVSVGDLFATALELGGVDPAEYSATNLESTSLIPYLLDGLEPTHDVWCDLFRPNGLGDFAEKTEFAACLVQQDGLKLILDRRFQELWFLFDLVSDPLEQVNLAHEPAYRDRFLEMQQALAARFSASVEALSLPPLMPAA